MSGGDGGFRGAGSRSCSRIDVYKRQGHNYEEAAKAANGGDFVPANGDPEAAQEYFATALEEHGVSASDITLSIDCGDSSSAIQMASFYQETWQQAFGITVEVNSMITKQVAANRSAHDFDLSLGGWGPDYNDPISDLDLWVCLLYTSRCV